MRSACFAGSMSLIFICIWQPGHIAIGQVSFGIAHPVSLEPFEARFRGADLGQLVKRDPAAQNAGYLRGLALRHVSPGNHDDKVSAKTCDASCPVPNARAAGRQEPPCSVSTLPPTQLPAQPKPRPVLHETTQSCAQAPSVPRSTAEIHASLTPIISLPKLFPSILTNWARLCENPGRTRTRTR
jgi:hypothetical protein